jgi:hypothetical protein
MKKKEESVISSLASSKKRDHLEYVIGFEGNGNAVQKTSGGS